MAIRSPYKIHRQMHLGDMLDELQSKGALEWRWEYDVPNKAAVYWVQLRGKAKRKLDTRRAEAVVQKITNELGIVWIPAAHHGGIENWAIALDKMEKMKAGELPKPWESAAL